MSGGRAAGGPVLDPDAFRALAGLLGAGQLAGFCQEAEIEIERRLNHLRGAEPSGAATTRLAHDLVGLAGQMGLTALAEAARDLQRAAREGKVESTAAAAVLALGGPSLAALRAAAAELRAD